jgi:hypothetical protein
MNAFRSIWALALSLTLAQGQELKNDANWKKLAALRPPIKTIQAVGGSELQIDGVRCRLFGVRIPDDPTTRAMAKRFLELYVEDHKGYFVIYNDNAPITDSNGLALIWLQGSNYGGATAQEALVQARLARVDYAGFEGYRFRVLMKAGHVDFDWKDRLKSAELDAKKGKSPEVMFNWPERKAR